jgi:hypothetical protein
MAFGVGKVAAPAGSKQPLAGQGVYRPEDFFEK